MILGGDQPWTRRVIGVSTCPQVGSMSNEGIWNARTKTWEGSANPRTMEGDEANYTAFLLGTPSLQAAVCSTQPILKLPRAWVVLCILHLTMAMGRLLGEFVDREATLVTPALCRDLQVLLSEKRAGWSVYGSASPDGEETANFFDAWPDIAKCLGIRPSTAKYKAIANMWDLPHTLYCTYQGPNPLNCAAVARDFRRHCTAGTASWYLLSLEQDVDTMLHNIKPFGLAMLSGDISERINRFLKHGHNEHSNRGGGGGGCRVEGVDEVSRRQLSAIHREANVQVQCMTWLFAYFDVSWVVYGGPRSQVPCSGTDAMEVRRGQGHMQPSLNQNISIQDGNARAVGRAGEAGIFRAVRSSGDLGNHSSLDLGSTIGR